MPIKKTALHWFLTIVMFFAQVVAMPQGKKEKKEKKGKKENNTTALVLEQLHCSKQALEKAHATYLKSHAQYIKAWGWAQSELLFLKTKSPSRATQDLESKISGMLKECEEMASKVLNFESKPSHPEKLLRWASAPEIENKPEKDNNALSQRTQSLSAMLTSGETENHYARTPVCSYPEKTGQ